MKQVIHTALKRLQDAGFRITDARHAIIETLAKLPQPATILEIANRTDVDTVTVYRNISLLVKTGVVEEIVLQNSPERYSLAHDHHHDHITCTKCGLIVHIPCTLKKAKPVHHPQFANISHHTVTYYGLCVSCANSACSS